MMRLAKFPKWNPPARSRTERRLSAKPDDHDGGEGKEHALAKVGKLADVLGEQLRNVVGDRVQLTHTDAPFLPTCAGLRQCVAAEGLPDAAGQLLVQVRAVLAAVDVGIRDVGGRIA